MKYKFFLCLRPMVTETEKECHVKISRAMSSSPAGRKNSGRRCRVSISSTKSHDDPLERKMVGDKHNSQHTIKSKSNGCLSGGNSSPENPSERHSQELEKASPVTETTTPESFSGDKLLSNEKKKQIVVSNGGRESNTGVYLIVIILLLTIFFGKFLAIFGTLIWLCCIGGSLRRDGGIDDREVENVVVKSLERVAEVGWPPEEYKKRVIMEGLLQRKNHNRESLKFST